jgi:hypothetical protein
MKTAVKCGSSSVDADFDQRGKMIDDDVVD